MVIFIFLSSEIPFLCLFDPKIQRVSLRRNLVARLISVFRFLIGNNLISSNQSGFKPGDSWINQFLSIAHEIYKPFDDEFKVRVVFLNISKAFDIVWRKGVIFKLKQNGISGKLLSVTAESYFKRTSFFMDRCKHKSPTGINFGSSSFFGLYQRSSQMQNCLQMIHLYFR